MPYEAEQAINDSLQMTQAYTKPMVERIKELETKVDFLEKWFAAASNKIKHLEQKLELTQRS